MTPFILSLSKDERRSAQTLAICGSTCVYC